MRPQCVGTTVDVLGARRCGRRALPDSVFCYGHDPAIRCARRLARPNQQDIKEEAAMMLEDRLQELRANPNDRVASVADEIAALLPSLTRGAAIPPRLVESRSFLRELS